jgi:hypothetical protein
MALDLKMDSVDSEDPSLATLNAFEEDFLWDVKIACLKSKGRREILNLVSSINYGDPPLGVRKGRLMCGSGERFLRVRV